MKVEIIDKNSKNNATSEIKRNEQHLKGRTILFDWFNKEGGREGTGERKINKNILYKSTEGTQILRPSNVKQKIRGNLQYLYAQIDVTKEGC